MTEHFSVLKKLHDNLLLLKKDDLISHLKNYEKCSNKMRKDEIVNRILSIHANEKMDGAGFMDFIKDPIGTIKEALLPIPSKLNNISTRTLEQFGDLPIQDIFIARTPVHSFLINTINAISRGTFNKLLKKYGYDKLFHLSAIVFIDDRKIVVEKNEVINIAPFDTSSVNEKTEYLRVGTNDTTLKKMIDKTQKYMDNKKFYDYSSLTNNCQNFIHSFLLSNGLLSDRANKFLFQDMSGIVKDLKNSGKEYVSDVLDGITNMGSKFSRIIAKGKHSGEIQAILFEKNKWTVDDAKKELKKLGYKLLRGKKIHITGGDDPNEGYIRFRIKEPNYENYDYKIIWFSKKDGIRAIYAYPK